MSFAVLSACGSKSDSPAAQPGAVAGKVLEVTGAVKVGATPLAVGTTVKTDDVIETGMDGNVVIELAHNRARWELGPNNKKKPTESLACTAAQAEDSAVLTAEQTSAAGRPAERSAADGTSSAPRAMPAQTAEAAADAVAPARARSEPAHGVMSAVPSPADRTPEGGGGGAPKGESIAEATASAGPGAASKTGVREDAKLEKRKQPTDTIESLASCVPIGMTVRLKARVANHVPAISFTGTVDRTVAACITTAAKKLSLSVETGEMVVTLTK
ncbi:hypothetical protein BH11MYX1_BH11MYX1_26900 [soil metagenome]